MSEEEIIDKVMMIDQWKVSGDIYTQNELNAIGELLDLYNKEKEKNKELEKENTRQHELLGKIHEKYQRHYIPKSKVREKIETWESICRAEQLEGLNDNHTEYWSCFEDVLEKIKEQLLQEGDK